MYRYVGARRCIGMWEVGDVSVCGGEAMYQYEGVSRCIVLREFSLTR